MSARLFDGKVLAAGAAMIAASVLAQPAFAGSCGATQTVASRADLVDTAVEAGSFKTLVAAVQAAGLVDALKGEGPLTVFAPTDEAFAKLPAGTLEMLLEPENRETLVAILTYHVSPGSLKAADVAVRDRLDTLNGQQPRVVVDAKGVMVGEARVTATDILASNGVIHVIDAVILPENLVSSQSEETGRAVASNL